jgi:hypothetical protein
MIIGLLSSQVDAQRVLKLNPKESKQLKNSSPWSINATCAIQSNNKKSSKVKIKVLKNSGVVNGKNLSQGQATFVNVSNNSNISVSAESGTEINLMNLSTEDLKAFCNT